MTRVPVRAHPKQTTRLWHTTSRQLRISLFQLDGDFVIIDKQRACPGTPRVPDSARHHEQGDFADSGSPAKTKLRRHESRTPAGHTLRLLAGRYTRRDLQLVE